MTTDTNTPVPVFEKETGYLHLKGNDRGGCYRAQTILRIGEDGKIYLWWKYGKREVPITIDQLAEWGAQ